MIGKLGKHGLAVSVSLMLSRLVGFVLLPFLTRALDEEQYGIHDYLVLVGTLLGIVAAQGVPSAVFRAYAFSARTDADKAAVIATGFRYVLLSTLAVMGACALAAAPVADLVTGDRGFASLLVLVLATHFLKNLTNVCAQILRADFRSRAFITVYCGEFVLCVGLNILFVLVLDQGLAGYVHSNLIGAAAAAGASVAFVPRALTGLKGAFDVPALKGMLRFGMPLVPGSLALFLLDYLDRAFFRVLLPHDFREVSGLFGRGVAFAAILQGVLLMPFTTFWPSVYYELARRDTAARDLGRCATWYAALGAFLATGLACTSRPLVALMTAPEFHEAWRVVPLLSFALFLYGFGEVVKAGIFIAGRTSVMPWLVLVGVLVNAGLNVLLIPPLGMMGAAWSSVGGYAAIAVAAGLVASRMFPVRYEWTRLARVALAVGVVLTANHAIGFDADASAVEWTKDLLLRGVLAAVSFPLFLVATGFVEAGERDALRDLLRRKARPPRP